MSRKSTECTRGLAIAADVSALARRHFRRLRLTPMIGVHATQTKRLLPQVAHNQALMPCGSSLGLGQARLGTCLASASPAGPANLRTVKRPGAGAVMNRGATC